MIGYWKNYNYFINKAVFHYL